MLRKHIVARFWEKVSFGSGCWNWMAGKNQDGYGRFRYHGFKKQAHHVAFFFANGRWPKYLLHACDNPSCVNPSHLSEGTHAENIQQAADKGRFFGGAAVNMEHVARVRDLLACGCSNTEIADWLHIDQSIISRIKNRKVYARLAA